MLILLTILRGRMSEFSKYDIFLPLVIFFILENSKDADEMPQNNNLNMVIVLI